MGAEIISRYLARRIGKRLDKSEEEVAVLNYGLFMIVQTIYSIIWICLVGVLTGLFKELIIISVCNAMMKRYAGGPHASTPNRCLFIGLIIATILAFLCRMSIDNFNEKIVLSFSVIVVILEYYVLYTRCPVGSKQKPLKKESIRKRLRKKAFNLMNIYSTIIIILYIFYFIYNNYLIKSILISILFGIIIQIFTLSKVGEFLVFRLDDFLNRLI